MSYDVVNSSALHYKSSEQPLLATRVNNGPFIHSYHILTSNNPWALLKQKSSL